MRLPSERWNRVLDRAAGRRPAGHGVQSGGHGTAASRGKEDSRGGVAALDLIQRERFDLILTGDTLSPDVAQMLAESALPSVTKPFDLEEVLRVVRRALR
jgi:hypothetical protein